MSVAETRPRGARLVFGEIVHVLLTAECGRNRRLRVGRRQPSVCSDPQPALTITQEGFHAGWRGQRQRCERRRRAADDGVAARCHRHTVASVARDGLDAFGHEPPHALAPQSRQAASLQSHPGIAEPIGSQDGAQGTERGRRCVEHVKPGAVPPFQADDAVEGRDVDSGIARQDRQDHPRAVEWHRNRLERAIRDLIQAFLGSRPQASRRRHRQGRHASGRRQAVEDCAIRRQAGHHRLITEPQTAAPVGDERIATRAGQEVCPAGRPRWSCPPARVSRPSRRSARWRHSARTPRGCRPDCPPGPAPHHAGGRSAAPALTRFPARWTASPYCVPAQIPPSPSSASLMTRVEGSPGNVARSSV